MVLNRQPWWEERKSCLKEPLPLIGSTFACGFLLLGMSTPVLAIAAASHVILGVLAVIHGAEAYNLAVLLSSPSLYPLMMSRMTLSYNFFGFCAQFAATALFAVLDVATFALVAVLVLGWGVRTCCTRTVTKPTLGRSSLYLPCTNRWQRSMKEMKTLQDSCRGRQGYMRTASQLTKFLTHRTSCLWAAVCRILCVV